MIIDKKIHPHIYSMCFNQEVPSGIRMDRIKRLGEILGQESKSNPSQFVDRLKDKTLNYEESKQLIEWFGAFVYHFDNRKLAIGVMKNDEVGGFIVKCRIVDVYLDYQLNNINFKETPELINFEVKKVNQHKRVGVEKCTDTL